MFRDMRELLDIAREIAREGVGERLRIRGIAWRLHLFFRMEHFRIEQLRTVGANAVREFRL